MLETQSTRWMDWIGLMYQWARGITLHKVFVQKDYKHWMEWKTWDKEAGSFFFTDNRTYNFQKLEEFYQDILELTTRGFDQQKFIFAHHRKGTVGSNSIDNTHPFETDKFILAQNGTDKRLHEWWIVEGIDPDRSDTFVLLQYLDLHCNTIQECLERIKILISRRITIGTIMIYSKAEEKIMFFADGERSLYISKNEAGTIDYIQSRKDDTYVDYKTKGYIVTDFTGQIYVEDLQNVNEEKIVHKTTTPHTYYTPPVVGTQPQLPTPQRGWVYSMYWDDYYDEWGWNWELGFQDINPDATDVNALEEENEWINYLLLADVMELLLDADEKKFRTLKQKVSSQTATQEETDEYVQIIVYIGLLIKRGVALAEKTMKDLENTKRWFLNLGRYDEHTKARDKSIQDLQLQMMELNAYKDIYKL